MVKNVGDLSEVLHGVVPLIPKRSGKTADVKFCRGTGGCFGELVEGFVVEDLDLTCSFDDWFDGVSSFGWNGDGRAGV